MTIELPDELFQTFVNLIRQWDINHENCNFHIFSESEYNREALAKIFKSIRPNLPFFTELKLDK